MWLGGLAFSATSTQSRRARAVLEFAVSPARAEASRPATCRARQFETGATARISLMGVAGVSLAARPRQENIPEPVTE